MTANQLIIGSIDLSPYIWLVNKPETYKTEIAMRNVPPLIVQNFIILTKRFKVGQIQPIIYCSELKPVSLRPSSYWHMPTGASFTAWESSGNIGYRFTYNFGGFSYFLIMSCELSRYEALGVIV